MVQSEKFLGSGQGTSREVLGSLGRLQKGSGRPTLSQGHAQSVSNTANTQLSTTMLSRKHVGLKDQFGLPSVQHFECTKIARASAVAAAIVILIFWRPKMPLRSKIASELRCSLR